MQHYHFYCFFCNFQVVKWAQQLSLPTKTNTQVCVCICKPFQDKQSCRIIGARRTGPWRSISSSRSSCSNWTYFQNEISFPMALSSHPFNTSKYGKPPVSLESPWRDSCSSPLPFPRSISPVLPATTACCSLAVPPLRGPSLPLPPVQSLQKCLTAVPSIICWDTTCSSLHSNPSWLRKAQRDIVLPTQLREGPEGARAIIQAFLESYKRIIIQVWMPGQWEHVEIRF